MLLGTKRCGWTTGEVTGSEKEGVVRPEPRRLCDAGVRTARAGRAEAWPPFFLFGGLRPSAGLDAVGAQIPLCSAEQALGL